MASGFFMGGLAEADREAKERAQKDRQIAVQEGGLEVSRGTLDLAGRKQQNDIAMQQAQQAEADAKVFTDQLVAVRKAQNPEIYARTEADVAPMIQRQLTVAIAARKRIPIEQATDEAQQLTQAIVSGIRGLPDVVGAGDLQGQAQGAQAVGAAPGQARATMMQTPADAAKAAAVAGATTRATIGTTNALAADTGKAKAAELRAQISARAAEAGAVTAAQQSNQIVASPDPNDPSKFIYTRQTIGQPAPVPRSLVNITNTAETAESKARGEALAKEEGEIRTRADVGAATLDTVRQVRAIDADTGRLAPATEFVGGWMAALGAPNARLAQKATSLQAFNREAANFVLGKQIEQKGVQTEADAQRMQKTFGTMTNTRQANDFIMRVVEAQSTRMMQQAEFYREWRAQKNTSDGASQGWQKFIRETPIIGGKGENVRFFNEYVEKARQVEPGISDDQIIAEWRKFAK